MFTTMSRFYRFVRFSLLALFIVCLNVACQDNVSNLAQENQPAANCQVVQHTMGETCVPIQPQRVVILSRLDNALVLGVKPIGSFTYENGEFATFLPEQTKGIVNVGNYAQPNLERILSLQPDLIISNWNGHPYDRLSQIAPTVVFSDADEPYAHWRDLFKAHADVLGKTDVAEHLLSDYQQRIVELRQKVGDRLATTQVSVVNFFANDVRLYLKRSFAGQILEEVGLARPPAQDKDGFSKDALSLESIPEMAGDVIFLVLGGHEPSKVAQFTNHPLWTQLKAVQQGKVYEVRNEVWLDGYTPVAANLVLDDLFRYLIDE